MNVLFAVTIAACFVSFAITWAARRYALRRGLLDHPNERSSHELPTPRGAGIAIVVAFLILIGLLVVWLLSFISFTIPENIQKVYLVIVALIALYMLVALLLGLPLPIAVIK